MIKKLLLFVRLLFLPQSSVFSLDNSRGKLSITAKIFCFALLFCASFANAATYYSGINGTPTDANNLNNWWLNTNGTGGHPANFTTGGDIFIVQTGHSMATTAAWSVTGSLQIQTGGTLSVAAFDITISGTTSITGSLIHSSNTGTKTYVGLVTIASGGVWNNSSNTGVIFRGGITNNGTFTSGSGVHTFNTNNQSLTGNFSIPKITVTGVSLTNISTNTLNVATALDGTGTLINQGTLNIAASTVLITTLTATATGNKVNYSGATQTIKSTSYYDLTFTGSGVKTFGATTVATSNFINVASGVKLDLSANNGHTARVLILGGVGPLISSWGAQGSGAANTTDTYFTNTNYGRIVVSGTGTYDPVIDSNYASYTKGVSGKVNASYAENAAPTVLTAPNGTVFVNADFASYGTPAGTAPNFTLGTCNAFNSRTVATDVFLGNTTATIPATNGTFGDPCVNIVKRLSVVATYTEPICTGTSPGLITGSPPSGGNGTYTYLWEVSTTSAVSGYAPAPGTNNAKDYTPGNLTATSWFRRTVYSGLYASETIVIVQVNTAPVAPTAISNTAFCAGSATTLTVSGGNMGGNGGYAQWYTGSCGGTLVGSGDSITVTPTGPTTYYVRYQNGCTTTACFSKLIEATVSITAASAATPVCYNASAIQATPLAYSATTGTPTTYSITWNTVPTNSFLAVTNAALPAGNISVSVPAGTNPGVYTGTLTVKNGTCVSLQNTFTVTVNALPTITGTANVCIGSTTQLTGSATANATTPWTSGTPTVATVSNTGLVTGVAAGTSVITYKNSNGCTQTVTVTVNPLPTITGTANVCIGSTTQLTGSATADATTPWASGTPTVATVSNTGLVTGVAVGTSVITYKNSNGCTQTVTVTVNPLPTITGTANVCIGSTTQLTGSATPNGTTPWTSGTTTVATVSNTGLVTGVAAGTSVITYRNSNGCTQTVTVTVNPLPTITGTPAVCIGSTTQLTGSATADATTPWASGTPTVATVSNTGLVTGVAAGTSVITYKNSNGCTQTVTVTVNPLPTITGTPAVCIGSTTQLTGSAIADATTPWASGTPTVATVSNTGLVTGVAVGTSVITYKNSNGCTQTVTVTVNPLPTITGTANVCIGSTTQLTGSATPNGTTPWTSGTTTVATVSNTGLVTGVAAGTSVITYRNSNGCTQTVTVTVNPLPTITGTPAVCIGSTTQLTGSATADATTPWTSGTPTVATISNTGLVTGVAAGTSVITYKNSNGCTQTVTVTVNPFPTISGIPIVCVGSPTQLIGSATPNVTNPWTSSNPSVAMVSNTGLVIGIAQGTSLIIYTNSNGCTQTIPVTVNPQPAAPIVGTITQPTCVVPTGTVILSGLPSTGTWTLTRSPDAVVTTGTGTSVTISGLAANTTYTYTVGNGTCTSVSSNNIVINQLPLLATWNGGWTNGPPTINQPVVFAGDYTSAGDLNSCSCTVNAGVNVVISGGNTLTVTNAVTVNGGATLTFENNSSLMQDSEVINTGDITYKRTSSMRLSDFEYWSSPVKPQKLFDVSPLTLSDKYFGFNGDNWVITSPNDVMTVGKGYIIRGPQTYSNTVRADFTASFKGVPNNGNLSGETLQKDKFYLIGNPYPSALSANEFLKANSFINGTFYFWTHNTPLTTSVKDYDADDYAVFNLTGGVATEGAPTGDDAPGNNPFIPQGHIAAGQSFFASTNDVGTVVFTNKMREGGANNSQFFKPGKTAKETEKSRIWLNISNDKGAFKQMLVGYIDGATNGIDNRYDGESFDANPYLDFYSINNNLNYVIQGRALPFTDTDIIPLGYRSTIEGDFAISIQHTDGELVNQPVYIEDKATGIIHNLKNGKYTFTTKAGTFADRLVLRYTDKTLGTGDFENTENNILVSVKNKAIKVTSAKENIREVTVYEISGKLLYNKKKVSATELQITNLQSANQVLLVKVTLDNEHTLTKKVIFQ